METLYSDPFASVLFIALGFVFLLLEVFVPSGGILGLLSIASTLFGIFGFYHQGHPFLAIVSLLGFAAYGGFMIRFILKRISFRASMSPTVSSSVDTRLEPSLLREKGVSVTPLRPAGMALINGSKVDVVSAGGFIDRDVPVEVIEVSGNRVVVREIAERAEGSSS